MDEREQGAIQTDVYLDQLLERTLVRFHPSFRFEESLAARLKRRAVAPGPEPLGRILTFPIRVDAASGTAGGPAHEPAALPQDRRGRGLLVGGAIASGVSIASIAGAVLVWRRTRTATGGHVSEHAV